MRLLVVDDEPLERKAIKHIVEHSDLAIEVAGEAGNGREAVALARELKPDIILMDIKMPGMDGLTATKRIREVQTAVGIVILTAYDEFEYAHQAIKLGAVDYILKPARREDVIEVLDKVARSLEQQKARAEAEVKLREQLREVLPFIKTAFVFDLITGNIRGLADIRSRAEFLEIHSLPTMAMVIDIDGFAEVTSEYSEAEKQLLKQKVFGAIEETLSEFPSCLAIPAGGDNFVVVFSVHGADDKAIVNSVARRLGESIRETVEQTTPVTVTIGIGQCHSDVEKVHLSYREAVHARRLGSFFLGRNRVILTDDVHSLHLVSDFYPFEEEKGLLEKIKWGDREGLGKAAGDLLQSIMSATRGSVEKARTQLLEFLILLSRTARHSGARPEDLVSLDASARNELLEAGTVTELHLWLNRTSERYIDSVLKRFSSVGSRMVSDAMRYINENYAQQLSLEKVSEIVYLNPFYFSRIFKEETGQTFVEYVTKVRINRAKELLVGTDLSIASIASQTGFQDASYFSRVFQKVEGTSPTDFRNRFHKQEEG